MPKVMKASEVRIRKNIRLDPKTVELLEKLQKQEGLSQGKVIDKALQLLAQ
ncbi:ribbon-helix-helix protein, CopG family [Bacillus toyonensis]|uniref:ribbon-helix-helix protein, CopG family n=1 Tax=Bacillus toyonensis TaxID=155322 RepID=UPI00115DCC6F|nr:ribbon-helix-helix protein, CopG family [Bacillus toyonensis]